jgi:hypothetical protein
MESVIAEKFEAMIVLDTANSRMKDFYDVYKILTEQTVSEMSLHHAITQTFQTRQTVLPDKPAFFPKNFQKNSRNRNMWKAFLGRINSAEIPFTTVLKEIRSRLEPVYHKAIRK